MAQLTIAVALLSLGTGIAAVQEKSTASFGQLLAQVKNGDPKADFLQLRIAFTQTAAYKPYDNNGEEKGTQLFSLDLQGRRG